MHLRALSWIAPVAAALVLASCNDETLPIAGVDSGCTPSCEGRQCGNDGCGGSCGTCAYGYGCTDAGKCVAGACGAWGSGPSCRAYCGDGTTEYWAADGSCMCTNHYSGQYTCQDYHACCGY